MIISKIFLTGSWSMFRPDQWLYKSRQWPDAWPDPGQRRFLFNKHFTSGVLSVFYFNICLGLSQSSGPDKPRVPSPSPDCQADGRIKDAFRNWQLILGGLSGLCRAVAWTSIKSKHFQSKKTIDCNTGRHGSSLPDRQTAIQFPMLEMWNT